MKVLHVVTGCGLALALVALLGCGTPPAGPRAVDRLPPPLPPTLQAATVGDVPTAGTTFAGSQQVLTRAAGGRLYLAYTKSVEGVNQLYVAVSTDQGVSWADFPQISEGPTRSSNPHLVSSPDGIGLTVFWTKQMAVDPEMAEEMEYLPTGIVGVGDILPAADQIAEPPGEKPEEEEDEGPPRIRQIYLSRFDGTTWSAQEQLTQGGYNGFPAAVYDTTGVLHLVWYGADGTHYQIIYTRYEGGAWIRPQLVSLGYPDSIIPAIAVDDGDNLHVAWYKYAPSSRSYQIFYRAHDAATDKWTQQIQLSTGLAVAENAAVVLTPDGALHVVYDGDAAPGGPSSVYRRTLRDGAWSPQRLVGRDDLDAEMPTVTTDAEGVVHVLYHSVADGQLYTTSSSDWTVSRSLTTTGRNRSPSVAWRGAYSPPGVEYVWTIMDADTDNAAGRNRIRYGRLTL